VVLLVVDTLRPDHLGFHGYAQPTSPELDRLASEGLVFDNCFSGAAATGPAVAGLLTGRYPNDVRVKDNFRNLPEKAVTLAEILRQTSRVKTGAVVSNFVLRKRSKAGLSGAEQGFDYFDDNIVDKEINRPDYFERKAASTTDAALAFLDGLGEEDRFFLWVHYQDPHGPYSPPPDAPAPPFSRGVATGRHLPVNETESGKGGIPCYQVIGDERDPSAYVYLYDAEIAYLDREVGRLVSELRNRGLLDRVLVVLTADHGEALGEHDYWFSHGENTYGEVVRVPLVIRYPDPSWHPRGEDGQPVRRHDGLVGHVDLFSTILEAMGTPAPPSRGESLLGRLPSRERVLLQEHRDPFSGATWFAATDDRYRLIVRDDRSSLLVDYRKDREETVDLSLDRAEAVDRLSRAMEELVSAQGWKIKGDPEDEPPFSREELEILEKLGYIDPGK
jgi:arylsulfatase